MENNNKESNDLHYRFTAYVSKALDNAKLRYTQKSNRDKQYMVSLDEMIEAGAEIGSSVDIDTTAFLRVKDFEQLIENDALCLAILELTGKERQILSLHIIYKVPFTEIADLMGVNYKTVYSIYARSLKKIQKKLGGDTNE